MGATLVGLLAPATVAGRAAAASGPASALPPGTIAVVRSDAAWIMGAIGPGGAIRFYPGGPIVSPYLGNQAATGLARATEVTADPSFGEAAWQWLAWYQAHEGPDGFVTDYHVNGSSVASTGDMDSTDAYAGTFLSAALETWRAAADPARLSALVPGISAAVGAIEATRDRDGLTWAKPTYHVKYLMDESETYAGLRAAASLAGAAGDDALSARATADAAGVAAGVGALWDGADGAYDWAVDGNGGRAHTDWGVFYPDTAEQSWAVAFGLAPSATAAQLVQHVLTSHPEWDEPAVLMAPTAHPSGYWPVIGLALLAAGRTDAAIQGAAQIQAAADSAGRAWPFTPADAANLILLDTGGLIFPPLPAAAGVTQVTLPPAERSATAPPAPAPASIAAGSPRGLGGGDVPALPPHNPGSSEPASSAAGQNAPPTTGHAAIPVPLPKPVPSLAPPTRPSARPTTAAATAVPTPPTRGGSPPTGRALEGLALLGAGLLTTAAAAHRRARRTRVGASSATGRRVSAT